MIHTTGSSHALPPGRLPLLLPLCPLAVRGLIHGRGAAARVRGRRALPPRAGPLACLVPTLGARLAWRRRARGLGPL